MKSKFIIKGKAPNQKWIKVTSIPEFDTHIDARKFWAKNKHLVHEYQREYYKKYAVFEVFKMPDRFKLDLDD